MTRLYSLWTWVLCAYGAITAVGVFLVIAYIHRTYKTSWYDKPQGNQTWKTIKGLGHSKRRCKRVKHAVREFGAWASVKDLMILDPLEHEPQFQFRRRGWLRLCRDIAILLFSISIFMAGLYWILEPIHPSPTTDGNCCVVFVQALITKDQGHGTEILLGFLTLAAALTATFYQWRVTARSVNRQKWIDDIRVVLAEIIADLPSIQDIETVKQYKKKRAIYRNAKLELLLNPSEEVHRALMALLRHAYGFDDVPIDNIPRRELELKALNPNFREDSIKLKSQIIRLSNVVLKREWEQVKGAK